LFTLRYQTKKKDCKDMVEQARPPKLEAREIRDSGGKRKNESTIARKKNCFIKKRGEGTFLSTKQKRKARSGGGGGGGGGGG